MSKKNNTTFLAAYIELDTACNELFELKRGGVTEYINQLKENKSIPRGEETLSKLTSYRRVRNKLAHEDGALTSTDDIDRNDIRWIKDFKKSVHKRKDPLSLYNGAFGRFTLRSAIIAASAVILAVIVMIIAVKCGA